jgi:hypothetical protein
MAFLFKNNASGTLLAGITNVATTLTLQAGEGTEFPSPAGGDSFRATLEDSGGLIEIIDVTNVTGDVFTMTRGLEGTTAKAYLAGDVVELRITQAVLDSFHQGSGILDTATVPQITITDNLLDLGIAGSDFTIEHVGTARELILRGGDVNSGALHVFGSAHASQAGDWELKGGGQNVAWWDDSVGILRVYTGLTETLAITIDANQDATFAGKVITGPQVTNHIRAGNLQIDSGELATGNFFDVSGNVVENTWESVGPTGSGADNIWTDMDVIPANATILIVAVTLSFYPNSPTIPAILNVWATHGDDATPSGGNSNRIASKTLDLDAAFTSVSSFYNFPVFIPLGATNQDFNISWSETATAGTGVNLEYRGFITD